MKVRLNLLKKIKQEQYALANKSNKEIFDLNCEF